MNEQLRDIIAPDWTEQASCLNMWEEFDDGDNRYATRVCRNCTVKVECLESALKFEHDQFTKGMGDFVVVGIRGGYTAMERKDLHRSIQQGGWSVVKELQL